MSGRIVQVSVSPGGVPKRAVAEARVGWLGLEGDAHRNEEHHGGPDRAVCLFAMGQIEALAAEGHPVVPGALGENVTVAALDWALVVPGARLRLGPDVRLEVTRYTTPCFNIRAAFRGGEYARVSQKRHPGWSRVYARVIEEGLIRPGDEVMIIRAGAPTWPPRPQTLGTVPAAPGPSSTPPATGAAR
ncbi:MAG: MOSC domain-containing protein [Candidatus Rokubacteria bacterium]|nr:MOSC domain-containing protein [Candidatus Rokubacteria bacterium]